ncbi:MAG: hypothetical protein L6Q84_05875 [Polyangiaceae bacterium]|nr:hypothetical protein [Polyangiaceae bacterium]
MSAQRLGALVALAGTLVASRTLAANGCDHRVISNTTGARNGRMAVAQTQLLSPALLADRSVLPYFAHAPGRELTMTFALEMGFLPNVAAVPTINDPTDGDCEGVPAYTLRDYDIAVNTVAFTVQWEWVGLFASMVTTIGGTAGGAGERFAAGAITPMAFHRFIARPDADERIIERSGSRATESTFIIGPAVAFPYFSARAGWAPTGWLGSVASPELHLSATATWSRDTHSVAYLRVGVDGYPTSAGLSRAYLRQVAWQSAPRTIPSTGAPDLSEDAKPASFSTIHLEQLAIIDLFDAKLAVAARPRFALHEAQVGVHTPGYYPLSVAERDKRFRERAAETKKALAAGADPDTADTDLVAGVWGGVTGVPRAAYYDSQATIMPSASAELGAAIYSGGDTSAGRVSPVLAVHWNDPETIAQIPFARSVWAAFMRVALEL